MSLASGKTICQVTDLSVQIQELCQASLQARLSSYSPYSKFKVGAALLSTEGQVITGCNVENASYGLAICAERTACVKAISQGITDFSAVAISADLEDDFCGPCGACRQFLCEFNPDIKIYLIKVTNNQVKVTSLDTLFPDCFSPKKHKLKFYNQA